MELSRAAALKDFNLSNFLALVRKLMELLRLTLAVTDDGIYQFEVLDTRPSLLWRPLVTRPRRW
jgi:hypothetical protein